MASSNTAPPLVLVIGGARSGKSRHAEALAQQSGAPVTYVATAGPPQDAEMAERIAKHKATRPATWRTVETVDGLGDVITTTTGVVLVDCLTLWLSNLMFADRDLDDARKTLGEALEARAGAVILVTNEVGEGIVPATPLGRRFRDGQGVLNVWAAGKATNVIKMVAGVPLTVKPSPFPEFSL
ncbi:MAG: bifunctional adenosylcobinamide kinase/adenosylcobinamide-phosphate guanylyltransferase [Pseudomonadota bacterium]